MKGSQFSQSVGCIFPSHLGLIRCQSESESAPRTASIHSRRSHSQGHPARSSVPRNVHVPNLSLCPITYLLHLSPFILQSTTPSISGLCAATMYGCSLARTWHLQQHKRLGSKTTFYSDVSVRLDGYCMLTTKVTGTVGTGLLGPGRWNHHE